MGMCLRSQPQTEMSKPENLGQAFASAPCRTALLTGVAGASALSAAGWKAATGQLGRELILVLLVYMISGLTSWC